MQYYNQPFFPYLNTFKLIENSGNKNVIRNYIFVLHFTSILQTLRSLLIRFYSLWKEIVYTIKGNNKGRSYILTTLNFEHGTA